MAELANYHRRGGAAASPADDKFQTAVLTEIAAVTGALNAERRSEWQRTSEPGTPWSLHRALQDQLRIVNRLRGSHGTGK